MFATSATHRGAPFVGRVRERGILLHLLHEGLEGSLGLVQVAGSPGMGRRRLIADALRHGPDAEWIHLAPGGVEADLPRWIRTELLDLLETYPRAPVPSWCLHVLGRWAPELHGRARVPALGREPLPRGRLPELVGAAIGTLFVALTGQTLVVVDAGLWPEAASATGRTLAALATALRSPGTVLLAAVGAEEARLPDWGGTRTLELGPLAVEAIEDLVAAWTGAGDDELAGWMLRVTGGHPFFLHETVRWLEEMGHVRVDDEHGRIEFLDPVRSLPVPFNLASMLDARYRRLPPPSARLLHLLAGVDGREEIETIRRRAGVEDDVFEEAVAVLRRREFLLQRSSRRPLALASPHWRAVANEGARRFTRLGYRPPERRPEPAPPPPDTPLARTLRELDSVRRGASPADAAATLARVARRLRGRTGPAWDGVRGRLAVLAVRWRRDGDRPRLAALWVRWGLRHLAPDRHPALRRTLHALEAQRLETAGHPEAASACRRAADDEAIQAGHAVSAARIRAARAEGLRRRGRLEEAGRLAAEAEAGLETMGLEEDAARAGYTRVSALVDARRLEDAALALARISRGENEPGWMEVQERLVALQAAPLRPSLRTPPAEPSGWGWGLDRSPLWLGARETLRSLAPAVGRNARDAVARLAAEADALAAAGVATAAADLEELRLGFILEAGDVDPAKAVARVAGRLEAMDAPSRLRHLAEALAGLPAAQQEAIRGILTPLRLHAETPPPPPATLLRLVLTGRPRVENRDGAVPLALWPEWWRHLALGVLSAELLGETMTRETAEAILARAHEPPAGGLEAALHAGNTLWSGPAERAEGIRLRGDRLAVSWDGITCDAREILRHARAAEAAGGTDPAAALRHRDAVLNAAEGEVLPGVPGDAAARTRVAVTAAVIRTLAARRKQQPDPEPAVLWRWLEGAGRLAPVAGYAAALSARRGRKVLPRALVPGSP